MKKHLMLNFSNFTILYNPIFKNIIIHWADEVRGGACRNFSYNKLQAETAPITDGPVSKIDYPWNTNKKNKISRRFINQFWESVT